MANVQHSELDAKLRCALESRFAMLKQRLLLERLDALPQAETHALVIQRASEAAALAWRTGYPLVVFPCLFEEMADEASAFLGRQARNYWRGLDWAPPASVPARQAQERCPTRYLMLLRQEHHARGRSV